MSYSRDRDRGSRGVGAIAARDLAPGRRRMPVRRFARARAMGDMPSGDCSMLVNATWYVRRSNGLIEKVSEREAARYPTCGLGSTRPGSTAGTGGKGTAPTPSSTGGSLLSRVTTTSPTRLTISSGGGPVGGSATPVVAAGMGPYTGSTTPITPVATTPVLPPLTTVPTAVPPKPIAPAVTSVPVRVGASTTPSVVTTWLPPVTTTVVAPTTTPPAPEPASSSSSRFGSGWLWLGAGIGLYLLVRKK